MKLSSTVIASLTTLASKFYFVCLLNSVIIYNSDASITCANGNNVFEVSCTVSNGFTIVVNEACRKSYFPMVDFANSFVWGDSTVTTMTNPTGTGATDVVTGGVCQDSTGTIDYNVKPSSTSNTDSSLAAAFGWDSVPLNSCGISSTEMTDATTGNAYTKYDLYWNSLHHDGAQNMYQLGRVKFTCRIDPYQEDGASISITEDVAIADPGEQRVDLAAGLELQIGRSDFDTATLTDEEALSSYTIDATNTAQLT